MHQAENGEGEDVLYEKKVLFNLIENISHRQ